MPGWKSSTGPRPRDVVAEHPASVLVVVEQLRRRVPGGIGTYARGLLDGLVRCAEDGDGVEATLLASRGPRGEDPLAEFGLPLVTSSLPGRLLTRAWDLGFAPAPGGFDVVHAVSLAAPPLRRGGRLVVTVHDVAWRRHPEATTRRGARWHEAALGRAVRHADALVTPSRLVAADLAAWGVEGSRVTVVPNGADHLPAADDAATEALLARHGVQGEFVLTVGTLEPRKNLGRLVEAYARVRPALPGAWPLLIVGPDGWGDGSPPTAHAQGVVFTGAVDAAVLAGLYARARALAYVPLTEGYGLPPLEAMRVGVPTLVSDQVPSVHDVGDDAPAPAVVVDPLDVASMTAGLEAVLTDEVLRADLAARGAAHAVVRTWHAAARRYVDLWESLR